MGPTPQPSGPSEQVDKAENADSKRPAIQSVYRMCEFEQRVVASDPYRYGSLGNAQAVVLAAGSGSRMTTLTNQVPKAMLPIASIPMAFYGIVTLQRAGFKECTVVVGNGQEKAFQDMARSYKLDIKLDIQSVDPNEDQGTLDSLRHIQGIISNDTKYLFIVSGDLVTDMTTADIQEMFRLHCVYQNAMTMLTSPCLKNLPPPPGLSQKSNIGPDIFFINMARKRPVKYVCGGDYREKISLPSHTTCSGSIMACMDRADAHFYIITTNVLPYVFSESSPCSKMSSIKAELVPHIIEQQFKEVREPEYHKATDLMEGPLEALMHCVLTKAFYEKGRGCHLYNYDKGLCVRANIVPAYWHLNTQVPKRLKQYWPEFAVAAGCFESSDVKPKAVIKGNTVLGRGCVLEDRTTVANSTVGRGGVVCSGSKLSNSVLGDGVVVSKGCTITNSLIASNLTVPENVTIKSCIVASAHSLSAADSISNDTIEAETFYKEWEDSEEL